MNEYGSRPDLSSELFTRFDVSEVEGANPLRFGKKLFRVSRYVEPWGLFSTVESGWTSTDSELAASKRFFQFAKFTWGEDVGKKQLEERIAKSFIVRVAKMITRL